ncbi:glutamate synthase central domain-containing protein, partial [Pseudoalteromonas undina]
QSNIIIETVSVRDAHQFALLLGFGETAIYPYLAYESLVSMSDSKVIEKSYCEVTLLYRKAINKGLYKIMSKMG